MLYNFEKTLLVILLSTTFCCKNYNNENHYNDFAIVTAKYEATKAGHKICLLYTSPSPRDPHLSRMPSSA